jgi:ribosomal-protein-alanine N-acetyltransferase
MCFTALDGDTPIAYFIGRIIPPEGELYRIATAQRWRGRGVAYRLLDYAVKTSRGVGLETLFLEVRESNLAAISLYRSYGFREISKRKDYYRNPTENAIIMLLGRGGI